MVWGAPRGVDDIVTRLRANDIGLKSLYLMRNRRFEEADAVALCDALQSNTVLIDLNISSHAVTPAMASAFAAALAANSTLKSLALGNASFGDEALEALCPGLGAECSLETLDLDRKSITAKGCQHLAAALQYTTCLSSLILSHNDIAADGVKALCPALGNIQHLDLSGCGITCVLATEALSTLVSTSNQLQSLHLSENTLEAAAVPVLSQALYQATTLKELHLRGCTLAGNEVYLIAHNLPKSIEVLDISDCAVEDQGFHALASALSAFTTKNLVPNFRKLVACNCQVGDTAVVYLATGLSARRYNESFGSSIDLDLGGNSVGTEGITKLSECSMLRALCLHDCKLGTEGAQALIECLSSNNNDGSSAVWGVLQELDLSGNGIEESEVVGICEALQNNPLSCPLLNLLVVAANPGASEDGTTAAVEALQNVRPGLNVVRRSADSGEQKSGGGTATDS